MMLIVMITMTMIRMILRIGIDDDCADDDRRDNDVGVDDSSNHDDFNDQ